VVDIGLQDVSLVKVHSRLRYFDFLFSDFVLFWWKICMQNDYQQFILLSLLHGFSSCMVLSALPYSSLLFRMCNAYAEIGLYVLMYLVCSRCRIPIDLPV